MCLKNGFQNRIVFHKLNPAGIDVACLSKLVEARWRIYESAIWPLLVQVMACRLVGAKPFSEPMLEYYQLDISEHTSVTLYSKFIHFHKENELEQVICKIAAILSWHECLGMSRHECLGMRMIVKTTYSEQWFYMPGVGVTDERPRTLLLIDLMKNTLNTEFTLGSYMQIYSDPMEKYTCTFSSHVLVDIMPNILIFGIAF